MNEKEKMLAGNWYLANDAQLVTERTTTRTLLQRYNLTIASDFMGRDAQLRQILGKAGNNLKIEQPFWCDYGKNIEIGENFYSNFGLTILDGAKVTIGDNVKFGPNCNLYTVTHPKETEKRNQGLEQALPITIGNNVWLGGNVTILPGVSIGDNAIVGAGSVVTKNVPANTIFAGVPAKKISVNYDTEWQTIIDITDKALKGDIKLSTSNIQRDFSIGYGRAVQLLSMMEDAGIIKRIDNGKYELSIKSIYDINIPEGIAVNFPEDLEYYTANWQLIVNVLDFVLKSGKDSLSVALIQKICHIGYHRATLLIDTMEANNIVKREKQNGKTIIKLTVSSLDEVKIPSSVKIDLPK